jgi:hypothetical protein
MKKILFPLLGILLLAGCEKEAATPIAQDMDSTLGLRSVKRTVCHYTGSETNPYEIIEVADQSWINAHMAHGDAVDMDGDGFFDRENGCSDVDCDGDTQYNPDNSCVCVEGELKFTLDDGSIRYVHPEEQATGFPFNFPSVDWYGAKAACANLAEETGCDWYLPNLEELGAIYQQLFVDQGGIWYFDASKIDGGIRLSGDTGFNSFYYWSSEGSGSDAWYLYFAGGIPTPYYDTFDGGACRCVRR